VAPQTAVALLERIPASIDKGSWDIDAPSANQGTTSTTQLQKESDAAKSTPVLGSIAIVEVPARKLGDYFIESPQNEPRLTWIEGHECFGDGLSDEEKGFCYLAITHRKDVHSSLIRLLQALYRIPVNGWDYVGLDPVGNSLIRSPD